MLVSGPHPPHPRMCLYYACVCIYMCVYIYTVYVYIYICSMCNLWLKKKKKSPESSYVFALLYSLIFGHIKRSPRPSPKKYLRGIKCSSNVVIWLQTPIQIWSQWQDKGYTSTKQLHSPSLLFFPVPADVRWQHSGPFKFFKNVSTTLVLRNSSGSNILWNGNNQHVSLKFLGPKEDKTNTSCRLVLGEWTLNIEQTAVIIIINSVAIGCK